MRERVGTFAAARGGAREAEKGEMWGGGYAPDGSSDVWESEPAFSAAEDTMGEKRADAEAGAGAREGERESETGSGERARVVEEIALTRALIATLETDGISGHELASMYYRLAQLYLSLAIADTAPENANAEKLSGGAREKEKEEAVKAAKRGLQLDAVCLGTDHPIYAEVERWVNGLEKGKR